MELIKNMYYFRLFHDASFLALKKLSSSVNPKNNLKNMFIWFKLCELYLYFRLKQKIHTQLQWKRVFLKIILLLIYVWLLHLHFFRSEDFTFWFDFPGFRMSASVSCESITYSSLSSKGLFFLFLMHIDSSSATSVSAS